LDICVDVVVDVEVEVDVEMEEEENTASMWYGLGFKNIYVESERKKALFYCLY
jgi:hypothetical protein